MDRNYIAFISYRHLPLEMETAKKLHKRIEHYRIPRDLRKDGQKTPGYVFRDQDELPIASDLSANIRMALDRAQFLIVICTPETSKSAWVLEEIRYFLEHHDREHVLAVLADGTPETSFPAQLTELRSPTGELLDRIEPLAANIVADSSAKRARLFQVESLRLLAALIGCPFDALYRRELRYKRRRSAAVVGTAAVIAAAFIGMLLNRNAQIRAQLQQAQINESQALAALSQNAYREGDYQGALQYAVDALPSDKGDRPYVAEAEYALSRELNLYKQGVLDYAQSLEQDSMINRLDLSGDGQRLITADAYGLLRCLDTESGTLLWQAAVDGVAGLDYLPALDGALVRGAWGTALYDGQSGSCLWENNTDFINLTAISPDKTKALATTYTEPASAGPETVSLLDLTTGQAIQTLTLSQGPARLPVATALSEDSSLAALLLWESETNTAALYLADFGAGTAEEIYSQLPCSLGGTACRLLFTGAGDLVLAADDRNGESAVRLFDRASDWELRFATPIETEQVAEVVNSSVSLFASIDLLDCAGDALAVGSKHLLYMLDLSSGEIRWQKTLPGYLIGAQMYDNACLALAFSNGTVTFCTDDGYLSYTQNIYCFRGGYETDLAVIRGPSYDESVFVLVPDDYQQRAVVLRFVENENMTLLSARPTEAGRLYPVNSPSGALTAIVAYDPVGTPLSVTILHQDAELPLAEVALSEGDSWGDPAKLFLTENGRLISPRAVLNCRTGEFTILPEGLRLVSAGSREKGCVFSAGVIRKADGAWQLQLWTDGEQTGTVSLPEEYGDVSLCECSFAGGGGLAVLWLQPVPGGESFPLCYLPDGSWVQPAVDDPRLVEAGETGLLLAYADKQNSLHLLDLAAGTECLAEDPLSLSVSKLLFACEDRYLLVFSEEGSLSIVDTADGHTVHRSEHGNLDLHFSGRYARYELREAAEQNRLLVFYDYTGSNQAACLVIDRSSWACVGAFDGPAAYSPETGQLLVCPYLDGVYRSPLYSSEEIRQLAGIQLGS